MLFNFINCPKCESDKFLPDFEETIHEYQDKELKDCTILVTSFERSFDSIPDYLVFSCDSCGHTCKLSHSETLKKISESWLDMAYKLDQINENKRYAGGDKLLAELTDLGLIHTISEEDLKNNPLLRDLIDKNIKEI